MIKRLLTMALLSTALLSCSKSTDTKPAVALSLSGTVWYGPGSKEANGMTYYDHLSFVSATDVDAYSSYLIGKETDIYTSHLKYTISTPESTTTNVVVTGKDAYGFQVNDTYVYKSGQLTLANKVYTKL
jgi:hypothetical protein